MRYSLGGTYVREPLREFSMLFAPVAARDQPGDQMRAFALSTLPTKSVEEAVSERGKSNCRVSRPTIVLTQRLFSL